MKKVLLVGFLVLWSDGQKPQQQVVPCPIAPIEGTKGGTYVLACIETISQPSKEFKTKREAKKYAEALKVLGAKDVQVKEEK